MDRQLDRQMDEQMDGQTDRQTKVNTIPPITYCDGGNNYSTYKVMNLEINSSLSSLPHQQRKTLYMQSFNTFFPSALCLDQVLTKSLLPNMQMVVIVRGDY